MSDHYETLGIKSSAQHQEIKKAYFELAKKYHPDAGDPDMVKKFYEITEAYKTLSDEDLKKTYDSTLEIGFDKIKTAEEELISKNPPETSSYHQKRDSYRDAELEEFHRHRYKKAIFRVIIFTLFHAVLAFFLVLLLKGNLILGALAGSLIGFSHSLRKNFDIGTFFDQPQKRKLFRNFMWFILILGVLYFVALILFSILK